MGRDAIRLSVKITGQVLNSNFSFQEEIGCFGSMDAFLTVYCFWKMVNKGVFCV